MTVSSARPRAARAGVAVASALAAAVTVLAPHAASAQRPSVSSAHPATSARTAQRASVIKVKVDPRLFGVHDANLNSLTRHGTGSIRLWDSGTTWALMQPTDGAPNFSRLDQIVQAAHANGTDVTLVTAMTPAWAAADPANAVQTAMPDVAAYQGFLAAVMSHYKDYFGAGTRGIANYQVWNEANISAFWTGTPAQMATLTKAAYDTRNAVDPGAKIIAPALVARLGYQQTWLRNFYAQVVDGLPVWRYVDALSVQLYPLATYPRVGGGTRPGTPEDSMAILERVRYLLGKDHVPTSLPIWDTEVNYGMQSGASGGTSAVPISNDLQVAYVMRTYLLNAAQGIRRVDWYAYDMGNLPASRGGAPLGNTLLTDPSDKAAGILTPAGLAFQRIQGWMAGTLVGTTTKRPCIADKYGTYTCTIKYAKGVGRIYWNPYRTGRVTLAQSATKRFDQYNRSGSVKGGSRIKVGALPVLVRSRT
jgi:hypothetical protein